MLEKCWAAVKVELGVMRELRGQKSRPERSDLIHKQEIDRTMLKSLLLWQKKKNNKKKTFNRSQ